jgi:penicillin-insensitive murein endopeptidase
MTPRSAFGVALFFLAVAGSDARATAPTYVRNGRIRSIARFTPGRSVGSPTDGHLIGGAHLDDAPYLRIVPVYQPGDIRWGLGSLVTILDDSARAVHRQFPDAIMSVGHLSKPGGGDVDRHASHESGRDADIGFYIHSQTGRPLYSDHFVPFKGDGTTPSWPGAYFDDARNWALVSALVTDPHARVTYLFVATPIRARLLAYAERTGAPLAVRSRAAELLMQPHGSLPHDDHFHVRIGCPDGQHTCIELPTMPRGKRFARGPAGHVRMAGGIVAPLVAPPSPLPTTHAVAPLNPPPPNVPPPREEREETRDPEPSAAEPPAASWSEPVDDVDGPLETTQHAGRHELP